MKARRGMWAIAPLFVVGLVATPAVAANQVVVVGGEAAVATTVADQVEALGVATRRIAGPDRYATAARAARDQFPGGVDTVLLASGALFADGLAAVPLAADLGAALLLTTPDDLPASTRAELQRLDPDLVIILGGARAVSTAVETAVEALVDDVERVSGPTRYSTAAMVAQRLPDGPGGTVYVVRGDLFADAMTAGPAAGTTSSPILLVNDDLPAATAAEIDRRDPDTIVVVGGPDAVSADVHAELQTMAPTVRRLAGTNRYETALAVATDVFGDTTPQVFLVTGRAFPDAFGAGVLATDAVAPVLLVGDVLSPAVELYLQGVPPSPPVIDQGDATTVSMSEDATPTPFALTLSATDPDLDELAWAISSPPANGTASIVGPSIGTTTTLDFVPEPDAFGTWTFDVTVTDTTTDTDTITVTVEVEPVNDPPVVVTPAPLPAIGNVGLEIPDGPTDLLTTASDPADGPAALPLSTTAGSSATDQGGDVAIAADGSFTYEPPAGFTGNDTFDFEVCDRGEPGIACTTETATVTVQGLVWFVDGADTGADLGTLADPFTSLASFNGTTGGDVHLAETGTDYADGVELADGQQLIGEGASGSSLADLLGLTPPPGTPALPPINGTAPRIAPATGDGVTLAADNTVRGIEVAVTGAGTGIDGQDVGTLTTTDVAAITTEDGPALDLETGTATIDVGAVEVTSRAATGLRLVGIGGTVGIDSLTIPNPDAAAGYGVQVTGSTADITFGTVDISDTAVGTPATYDAVRGLPTNDGDGDGVFLKDNTGPVTIDGGTITDYADNAVDIRNSSDVTLANLTIDGNFAGNSAVQGHVVDGLAVRDTTIRELDNVNAANLVTDDGLRLFDVEGTVSIQRSTIRDVEGYVLANATVGSANRAVELNNDGGCTRDGDDDCTVTVDITGTTIANIDFQGVSLRHVGGTMTATVDGSTADGPNSFSRINGAAVSTGPSRAAAAHQHTTTVGDTSFSEVGIATEVFGTRGGNTGVTIADNTVTTTTSDAIRLNGFNQSGAGPTSSYRATVRDNTITGIAGQLAGSGGGAGVFVAAEDGADVRALVDNNVLTGHTNGGGNSSEALRTQNQRNGQLQLTFRNNTSSDFPTNFFGAVFIGNDNDTNGGDGVTTTCLDTSANSYTNAAGTFGATHGFDTLGLSVVRLPGYTGTTDGNLSAYLDAREATTGLSAATFGDQPVDGTCSLP